MEATLTQLALPIELEKKFVPGCAGGVEVPKSRREALVTRTRWVPGRRR